MQSNGINRIQELKIQYYCSLSPDSPDNNEIMMNFEDWHNKGEIVNVPENKKEDQASHLLINPFAKAFSRITELEIELPVKQSKGEDNVHHKVSSQIGKQQGKIYNCHLCDFVTLQKAEFANHLNFHSEEKTCFCEYCPYYGNEGGHLLQPHQRFYKCPFCRFEAVKSKDVRIHLLVHSDVKLQRKHASRMLNDSVVEKENLNNGNCISQTLEEIPKQEDFGLEEGHEIATNFSCPIPDNTSFYLPVDNGPSIIQSNIRIENSWSQQESLGPIGGNDLLKIEIEESNYEIQKAPINIESQGDIDSCPEINENSGMEEVNDFDSTFEDLSMFKFASMARPEALIETPSINPPILHHNSFDKGYQGDDDVSDFGNVSIKQTVDLSIKKIAGNLKNQENSEKAHFKVPKELNKIKKLECKLCNYSTEKKLLMVVHKKRHLNFKTCSFQCDLCELGFESFYESHYHLRKYHRALFDQKGKFAIQQKDGNGLKIDSQEKIKSKSDKTINGKSFAKPKTTEVGNAKRRLRIDSIGPKATAVKLNTSNSRKLRSKDRRTKINKEDTDSELLVEISPPTSKRKLPKIQVEPKHQKNDPKEILYCNICSFSTIHQATLAKHKDRHSDKYKLHCKVCKVGFNIMFSLKEHVRLKHTENDYLVVLKEDLDARNGTERFQCSHCVFQTDNTAGFKHHLLVHGKDRTKKNRRFSTWD